MSYSRQDRARAQALARAVEQSGWSVWWDHDLYGGASFAEEIGTQLDQASAVVVLWSKSSVISQWVMAEASRAGKRIVPVAIDPVLPPLPFNTLHTLDLAEWHGQANHEPYGALERTLTRLVGREPNQQAHDTSGEVSTMADNSGQAATAPPVYSSTNASLPTSTKEVRNARRFGVSRKVRFILGGCIVLALLALWLRPSSRVQDSAAGAPAAPDTGTPDGITTSTGAPGALDPEATGETKTRSSAVEPSLSMSANFVLAHQTEPPPAVAAPHSARLRNVAGSDKAETPSGKAPLNLTQPAADAVARFQDANRGRITADCLASVKRTDPTPPGVVVVNYTLDTQGFVSSITGVGGDLASPPLTNCFTAAVKRLRFPAPGKQGLPGTYRFWVNIPLPTH